ncbi:MAG: hypothetical protein RID23_19505 [Roseovarius sp.]
MKEHSASPTEPHEKNDREDEKREGFEAFFAGAPSRGKELSFGPSDEELAARNQAMLDRIDNLFDDREADQPRVATSPAPLDEDDEEVEIIRHEPSTITPYDKAFAEVRRLEAELDSLERGSDEYRRVMSDLARARGRLKLETDRGKSDSWRWRRKVDEWRKDEGHEKYNASRRTRGKPNHMTPKEVLDAMTPEERAQHDKDRNADRVNRSKYMKKFGPDGLGLSGDELKEVVEKEVERARRKRLSKRAGA